ncbi:glyoxalase, partial [Burkholderia sp. HAN2018]|nr:glyoxalase [Burkholderia sp. HAN2018]
PMRAGRPVVRRRPMSATLAGAPRPAPLAVPVTRLAGARAVVQ